MERCKIYGDPDKWLSDLISETKIRELIRSGKHAALNASNKNIDNKWARYWSNESIEFTFNFLESSLSALVRLLARKVLHWKTKIPKTSARKKKNSHDRNGSHNDSAHNTTYGSKTAKDGKGEGDKGRSLSKADISKLLS